MLLMLLVLSSVSVVASAQVPYASRGDGQVWMNGFGECWRTGSWSREAAISPCDAATVPAPAPRAAEPAPAPAVQAPPPPPVVAQPAPQPVPQPALAQPQKERITLSSDLLFEFNSAQLKDAGKRRLDELADRLRNAEQIGIVGHADRLGSARYNQKLSEQRAAAVKHYLSRMAPAEAIRTSGKGHTEPVSGAACKGEQNRRKLIECLQPDRRVELEVYGPRSLAGAQPAGSGATRPVSETR